MVPSACIPARLATLSRSPLVVLLDSLGRWLMADGRARWAGWPASPAHCSSSTLVPSSSCGCHCDCQTRPLGNHLLRPPRRLGCRRRISGLCAHCPLLLAQSPVLCQSACFCRVSFRSSAFSLTCAIIFAVDICWTVPDPPSPRLESSASQ